MTVKDIYFGNEIIDSFKNKFSKELNENVNCPKIYATYGVLWTSVNYELRLSNITQSKNGIYSISIVDKTVLNILSKPMLMWNSPRIPEPAPK